VPEIAEEHDAERYAPSMSCQSLGGIPVGGGRAGGGSHNPETSMLKAAVRATAVG